MLDSLDSISFAVTLSFPYEHHDLEAGELPCPTNDVRPRSSATQLVWKPGSARVRSAYQCRRNDSSLMAVSLLRAVWLLVDASHAEAECRSPG